MAKRRGGKKAKFMGAHVGKKHRKGGRKGGRRKR